MWSVINNVGFVLVIIITVAINQEQLIIHAEIRNCALRPLFTDFIYSEKSELTLAYKLSDDRN